MQNDTGLEINPQQIFELAMRGRYGVGAVSAFYFYILSCKFKAGLLYFYGTHGLSFSTPLSTFTLFSFFKMMTFITEVQNIVNDTSIPRPIRNKLFNDMQSDTGLEINPQQMKKIAVCVLIRCNFILLFTLVKHTLEIRLFEKFECQKYAG
jgi:hypothetical protein